MSSDPAPRTQRYVLAALAIAVAVGLFLLVWELRGAERSRLSSPDRAPARATDDSQRRAAAPRLVADGDEPPVEPSVAWKEDPEDAPVVPVAEALAGATRRLQDDLRACEPQEDSSGVITVSYSVVFEGGAARVDDARVVRGSLSADLQDCALDRIRAARWEVPGTSDTRARRVDSFVVGAAY